MSSSYDVELGNLVFHGMSYMRLVDVSLLPYYSFACLYMMLKWDILLFLACLFI